MGKGMKGLESLAAVAPANDRPRGWVSDRSMPILLNHLLAFIKHYQQTNSGATPTVAVCANELGVTDAQIRLFINKLEQEGRLHRYGQNPIRIMVKDSPPLLEHARRLTAALKGDGKQDGSAQERYEAVDVVRQKLGQFLAATWKHKGRPPTFREMADHIGGNPSFSWMEAQINILRDRGLVMPGVLRLTDNGAIVYGLKSMPAPKEETPVPVSRAGAKGLETDLAKHRERFEAKLNEVHSFMTEFVQKHGRAPMYREVAEKFSGGKKHPANVQNVIVRMEERKMLIREVGPDGHSRPNCIVPLDKDGNRIVQIKRAEPRSRPKETRRTVVMVDRASARRMNVEAAKKAAQFIEAYRAKWGQPPLGKEIAEHLGWSGHGGIVLLLAQMQKRGWLKHEQGRQGDYEVTDAGRATLIEEGHNLTEIALMPDSEIDTTDMPETTDWSHAERGRFFVPKAEDARSEPLPPPLLPVSPPAVSGTVTLASVATADLIMELIERGYIVQRR